MKKALTSGCSELPDLGSATRRVTELFDRALQGKQDLQNKIRHYATKPDPSVRDLLTLCYYRNELSFVNPPLPSGDLPAGIQLWRYWIYHPEELRRHQSLREDILSYLIAPEDFKAREDRTKAKMLELLVRDSVTLLAFYPIVKELGNSRGRPVSRRPMAVKALQMKLSTNRKWREITSIICDCGKDIHTDCVQAVRQSVIGLKRLLRKCGTEVPGPASTLNRR